MVTFYRLLGVAVVLGLMGILGTGYTFGTDSDTIPGHSPTRNSPGAYRSYFILYGGK